jgi:hypothetical protein
MWSSDRADPAHRVDRRQYMGDTRQQIYRSHMKYRDGDTYVECPLSGNRLRYNDKWDMHEVFVQRNDVAPKQQDLIFVAENCIPLDHNAHIARGNTREALKILTPVMFRNIGAEKISEWYFGLIEQEGLSLPKGFTPPPKHMRPLRLIDCMYLWADINDRELPRNSEYWYDAGTDSDIRAQVALRFTGRRRKWKERLPKTWKDYSTRMLSTYVAEGYYARKMMTALGI